MNSVTRPSFLMRLAALAMAILLPALRLSAADPSPASAIAKSPLRHRFLAVDDGTHTLVFVDENAPERNWTVSTGYVMDMQLISKERVLLSVDDGIREYDVATGKLLSGVKGSGGKTHTIYRVGPGRTIIAGENLAGAQGASLAVYDSAGEIIERKAFPSLAMLRHLRPTSSGGYVLTAIGQVLEVDSQWKILWKSDLAGNLFKAIQLTNGNFLCSSGPGARFIKEINRQGSVVREIRGDQLPEGSFTGFHLRPHGGIVVANWLGHGPDHNGIVLVEYDRNGAIIWRYGRPHASFVEVIMLDGAEERLPQPSER